MYKSLYDTTPDPLLGGRRKGLVDKDPVRPGSGRGLRNTHLPLFGSCSFRRKVRSLHPQAHSPSSPGTLPGRGRRSGCDSMSVVGGEDGVYLGREPTSDAIGRSLTLNTPHPSCAWTGTRQSPKDPVTEDSVLSCRRAEPLCLRHCRGGVQTSPNSLQWLHSPSGSTGPRDL